MATRRDFIRKAALGSASISAVSGLSALGGEAPLATVASGARVVTCLDNHGQAAYSGWELLFDETGPDLSLTNGEIAIRGRLSFISDNKKWGIAKSRDGIPGRYAFVDPQGNVQGYFIIDLEGDQFRLSFYHRTAQAYQGVLTYEGMITFPADGFTCRTRAKAGERVLSLRYGMVDLLSNDSIFSPESDLACRLDAAKLQIITEGHGTFSFSMGGQINESSEAVFSIILDKGYFKNRFVPYYHPINRKRCPGAPTGWMSWNTYFDTATAGDNLAEARIGKKYLQPFGCEFWHIESWQGNSDKLPVRDFYNLNLEVSERKFPKGMKKLAEDIKKLGFRPGLWTAPFGTGNKEFYEAHKNWFLHYDDGKPVSCWNGRYTIDPTVPEARDHIRKIHKTASSEWGYEYFKVDGMSGRSHSYCAHLYERPEIRKCFKDPSCPNPFELVIKAIREGIGDDRVFLACQGHTSGPEVMYADASRIGADIVSPNKPVQWHGVYNQGRCILNQAFTHNIVMFADPDTLLVRDLPLEEARVSATIVALPGQLTFFGDKLAGLPAERMKLLQQTLPVVDVRPVSLYPYFSMLPVWNLRIQNAFLGNYNVVALFNWEGDVRSISFTTDELGIDKDADYLIYEFWTQKSYGKMKASFSMEIPPHSVRLLAMHKEKDIPQWISSDRHISQNAMELKDYRWNTDLKTLEGRIRIIGSFPLTMRLHIPPDYSCKGTDCPDMKCSVMPEPDNYLAVSFLADKTGDYAFRIKF
jgi:hypothetical protein